MGKTYVKLDAFVPRSSSAGDDLPLDLPINPKPKDQHLPSCLGHHLYVYSFLQVRGEGRTFVDEEGGVGDWAEGVERGGGGVVLHEGREASVPLRIPRPNQVSAKGGGGGMKREKGSFSDTRERGEREGGKTDLSVDQEPKVARIQGLLLKV